MSLQLKKFNMNMIKDDSVVVMIGKRNTGKSFLTKDLLFYHQDLPAGTVISPTENANKFYSDITHDFLEYNAINLIILLFEINKRYTHN